jgi:hypothetical protein
MARSQSQTEPDVDPDDADSEVVMPDITPKMADEIRRIAARSDKLTAELVVAEAVDPNSPLHKTFEWDDSVAAHEYRLEQARSLIRRIHINVDETPVREYLFVRSTGSYQHVADVMSTRSYREELLARFEREAASFEARWKTHQLVARNYRAWVKRQADKT